MEHFSHILNAEIKKDGFVFFDMYIVMIKLSFSKISTGALALLIRQQRAFDN